MIRFMAPHIRQSDTTIAAISSSVAASARAVLRVSGPDAWPIADTVFRSDSGVLLADTAAWSMIPGRMTVTAGSGLSTDLACFALVFPAGASYTGENTVEFHMPGSPPVLEHLLEQLLSAGAVAAGPGEFTARAFFNGRLDLAQAQGVAELIHAANDAQLRAAARLLDGALSVRCDLAGAKLLHLAALVEAAIDFTEEDIQFIGAAELAERIAPVIADLNDLLSRSTQWRQLSVLPRVVLAGCANAGKSSLVNVLSGVPRSIISATVGTTRDVLEVPLSFDHAACVLIDTAGIDGGDVPVGHAAVTAAAITAAQRAWRCGDLGLWVFDASTETVDQARRRAADVDGPVRRLFVANKCDLPAAGAIDGHADVLAVSAVSHEGLEALKTRIHHELFEHAVEADPRAIALTAQQRTALKGAVDALHDALELIDDDGFPEELAALHLRAAVDQLGAITGSTDTEDLLGVIFANFCVGK